MISVDRVSKRYGRTLVVDDISFDIAEGDALALWGPNGAGKTTVARCVLGLVEYEGSVTVSGLDARSDGKAVRAQIGYVPQELEFFSDLTVAETLQFSASLRRITSDRTHEMIQLVGLTEHQSKRVAALSGGMKQRLGLAVALLPDPPVLLLDEPTSNLDAAARSETVELLEELRDEGRTMLVTSHHLEEVGLFVDRVLAMDEGRFVAECAPTELADRLGLKAWLHIIVQSPFVASAVDVLTEGGFPARPNSRGVLVEVAAQGKGRAVQTLQEAGIEIMDLEIWR